MKIYEFVKILLGLMLKAQETQTHLKLPGKALPASAREERTSLSSQGTGYSRPA